MNVNWESVSEFGPESRILEIPVSWYLDDWPAMEYVAGKSEGLGDTEVIYRRWKNIFDYARGLDTPAVYALTIHPQCSGRSHIITVLDRLLTYMRTFDDVWFASLSEVRDRWTDDEPVVKAGPVAGRSGTDVRSPPRPVSTECRR